MCGSFCVCVGLCSFLCLWFVCACVGVCVNCSYVCGVWVRLCLCVCVCFCFCGLCVLECVRVFKGRLGAVCVCVRVFFCYVCVCSVCVVCLCLFVCSYLFVWVFL